MKFSIVVLFLLLASSVSAQFSLRGKLRTLRPVTIKVMDLAGNTITECTVKSDEEFKTEPIHIRKDLYVFHFGEYTENIILTDNPVTLNGFLNDQKPENSSMEFERIDLHMQFLEINEKCNGRVFNKEVFKNYTERDQNLDPVIRASLMYTRKMVVGYDYEPYKKVLDMIPENERESLVVQFVENEVNKRKSAALGGEACDFTFVDLDGKDVSLRDFKGKLVLIDFWASWCGPCRREMKSLLPIYQDLKGDDLVFISVSLDDKEKDWQELVEEEKLPWVMLWNKEGFPKGKGQNEIQKAYGFYQIPFIVLIGKDGKMIARGLRGDKVREAIEKAREIN